VGLSSSVQGCGRMKRRCYIVERQSSAARAIARPAFTLIDLLVSIAVMAVLIGIMLPSISSAQEAARRVVCRSNVRQIGLGIVMYANDHDGRLPPSVFLDPSIFTGSVASSAQLTGGENSSELTRMIALRVAPGEPKMVAGGWDGLGHLHSLEYTNAARVFYCPSHKGENTFSRFAAAWDGEVSEVAGNYHYRGYGPTGTGRFTNMLYDIEPPSAAILADGLQSRFELNHVGGVNIFRADLSADWFADGGMRFRTELPSNKESTTANNAAIAQAWRSFDGSDHGTGPN
jgi:competence protein ComGC